MFKLESSVNIQRPNSNSLRTTLPIEIVKNLNLEDKDRLVWDVAIKNDELVITVSKK